MSRFDRRTVLKGLGTGAAVLVGGGLVLWSSEPAVAATSDFSASNVTVTSTDGQLSTLTISPEITISWSDQPSTVHTVEVRWRVSTASNSGTAGTAPYDHSVSSPSQTGSLNHHYNAINLLSNNGGPLDGSTFSAGTDGTSTTTSVDLSLDLTLKDSGDNIIGDKNTTVFTKTFEVTVENSSSSDGGGDDGSDTASISVSGSANTAGT